MRATISLLALLAATPALAEDVFAQAPVSRAVIYPDGATLTLRATLDLPAGDHRVLIAYPNADQLDRLPRVAASDGVTIGALGFRRDVSADPRDFYTPEQTDAAEAVDAAEDAVRAKQDELAGARGGVEALEARKAYLAGVVPPESGNPEDVLALADLVAAQTAQTVADLASARAALRPLQDELEDLQAEVTAAEAALDRLAPPGVENDMLSVEVSVAEAGPVALEFTEQTWDAGWRVDYDMNLDREAGELEIDRKLLVYQETDRPWTGAELTLSTARPSDAIEPSQVYPDQADIFEPRVLAPSMARDSEMAGALMEEPMIEPAPITTTAKLQVDGLAVSYLYPDPVTVLPGEVAELALDTLTLAADPKIVAAPRWDETAFLTAEFLNTTGEPILPGTASLSRDGYFIGQTEIDMIPANGDETLGFGPIEGIRLDTVFKRNEEGDTGILSKSSTREQQITFTVENLTNEPQDLRALFPLTFSEKEDLEVEVTAVPAPNETDIDDLRGVSAWDMTLAPGETKMVEITVSLDWPEGKALNWNP